MANHPSQRFAAFMSHVDVAISTAADGLGEAADLGGGTLCGIEMSTAWTDAVITFKAGKSTDTPLFDLYGSTGDEITITTTASRLVMIDATLFAGKRFLQPRSGTGAAAVAQAAARTIRLLIVA